MNILGIGTDITECLRIAQMIERHGELFIERVYTAHEIQYCSNRKQATQHYAGRWAAHLKRFNCDAKPDDAQRLERCP